MTQYPVVGFLVRFGGIFAAVIAVAVVLAGAFFGYAEGSWVYPVGGLAIGALAYVLMKSYAEIVAIISDMLLPK